MRKPKLSSDKLVEIDLRSIDQYGDAIDIIGSFASLQEAREHIPEIRGEIRAWIIERHTNYFVRGKPDKYVLIESGGDSVALAAGGWLEGES